MNANQAAPAAAMPDLSQAILPGKRDYTKLLNEGDHVCKVIKQRWHNGWKSKAYFLEFEVVSGPTPAGTVDTYSVFPEDAKPHPRWPREKLVLKEYGKIKVAVGATYGFDEQGSQQVTNDVFSAVVSDANPTAGKLFVVRCNTKVKEDGHVSKWYDILPLKDQTSAAAPAPAVPPPPPAAPAPKTLEQVLGETGFQLHPTPGWVFRGQEVVALAAFKQQHGIA